ncbi:MAG TPA: pseudouridine synthase [Chitinivibrionales bacterium]
MSIDNEKSVSNQDGLVRLNRYCARCGLGSRRSCDTLIASGKIMVNGKKVTELGVKIDPQRDKVEYSGGSVRPVRPNTYLAYHKPRGVMVTSSDPQGRPTVYDALRRAGYDADDLRYIGRLDFNSEGLLLLTNDGDLIHALTHPRYHIKKVYEVCVDKILAPADARRMREEGIESEGQILKVGDVVAMNLKTDDGHWYGVDLYEGKKRQIRRIFEALGYEVKRLKRTQFAAIKIADLQLGAARQLTEMETAALMAAGFPVKRTDHRGHKGGPDEGGKHSSE